MEKKVDERSVYQYSREVLSRAYMHDEQIKLKADSP